MFEFVLPQIAESYSIGVLTSHLAGLLISLKSPICREFVVAALSPKLVSLLDFPS